MTTQEQVSEHVVRAEQFLRAALRAELAGCLTEAIPLAKQAEYECAQLIHALEMENRK